MTFEDFHQLVLDLEHVEENPHFDRIAFKVSKKRIFTTYLNTNHSANLKLSLVDQSVYTQINPYIYAVPNKWGKQGWTTLELEHLEADLVKEMLLKAYNEVFQ